MILAAYSMLVYGITGNIIIGMITDVISGLAVIAIAIIMYPIFATSSNRYLTIGYYLSRILEGTVMVLGGIFLLIPGFKNCRNAIYEDIHIYFFISGALLFYLLLYQSKVIPKFISIWGICGSLALLAMTVGQLMGFTSMYMMMLVVPIILNEVFLAIWLMVKGFNSYDYR